MRRSTGMGGGRMLRAVGRAVGAGVGGVKDTLSATGGARPTKPARVVSVSGSSASSASSSPSVAASATAASWSSFPCFCDGDEWETVEGEEEEEGEICGFGFAERFVFGRVPSKEEAEEAVSTLQQIFVPVTFSQVTEDGYPSPPDEDVVDKVITSVDAMQRGSSTESESDWIEPALHLYSSKTSQSHDREKVLDAFRLLQINPSIQRMVVSLSSDKAVWDAVMKNEVVQEFKKSFCEAESSAPHSSDEGHDIATGILRWILDSTKGKIMEFFDKITKLVNEIFHSQEKDKDTEFFDHVLRSSFMLSVMVFIIVVVTRVQKA